MNEDALVFATWGLVLVTGLLVVATIIGIGRGERHAERQLTRLAEQTTALVDAARASRAMADEMLEARRAACPLELDLELADDASAGVFGARLTRASDRGIILLQTEILVGRDRLHASDPVGYGNLYLGGSTNAIDLREPFDPHQRDLLILRVTGIPENGLEQSVEFHFRILPNGRYERLSSPLQTWGAA